MINEATIQAQFKQATVKGRQAMDFDDETGEIYG